MLPIRRSAVAALALPVAALVSGEAPEAQPMQLDFTEIFRCVEGTAVGPAECDRARELVTFNCTTCHLFVRIVVKQGTRQDWTATIERHRTRVPRLADAEMDLLRDYLAANFRPDLPPPEVPPELLQEFDNAL